MSTNGSNDLTNDGRPSGRRLDVLRELKRATGPLSIAQVAERLAVHQNTARYHLEALVATGRAEHAPPDRSRPGRPPLLFRVAPGMDPGGTRRYRLLAEVLTAHLADAPEARAQAMRAGRAWGRRLGSSPADLASAARDEGVGVPASVSERESRVGLNGSAAVTDIASRIPSSAAETTPVSTRPDGSAAGSAEPGASPVSPVSPTSTGPRPDAPSGTTRDADTATGVGEPATAPEPPPHGTPVGTNAGATAEAPAPRDRDPGGSRRRLVALLDDLGFAPEHRDTANRVGLRHCPFLELARTDAGVVCSIHLGLMQGALHAWRAPVTVDRLEPFAEPDLCVAHLVPSGVES